MPNMAKQYPETPHTQLFPFPHLGKKVLVLDMEDYQDLTNNQEGSNWIKRAGNNSWNTVGGTYLTSSAGNHFGDRRKKNNT